MKRDTIPNACGLGTRESALGHSCPPFVRCLLGRHSVRVRCLFGILNGVTSPRPGPVSDKFQHIFDSMPEKPPRSRLEPYAELIIELRRRKRTYREILEVLAEKCSLQISISTLHDFVRVKTREERKAAKLLRATARLIGDHNRAAAPSHVAKPTLNADRPTDEEVRRRIAALKARPKPAPVSSSDDFQFNPDEPLRLLSDPQKPQRG